MVASEFEYRHRFWMIVLVYVATYAFYNLDRLNILYSVVPWNQGVLQKDMLVRLLYAAAALLAAVGAILLTWSTAYRPPSAIKDRTAFSIAGPFRYVRNPQYLSYFLLILALGTFQSRLGFPVMLLAETILLFRLVAREELRLEQEYGERFRVYAQRVSRVLPSLRPRFENDGQLPWVCLRLCDHGILGATKACSSVLHSPAAYLQLLRSQISQEGSATCKVQKRGMGREETSSSGVQCPAAPGCSCEHALNRTTCNYNSIVGFHQYCPPTSSLVAQRH
jgi:protein-S-isoprenylcysteine O-methyltransferase Ste14